MLNPVKINHSAEAIDRKLGLIVENKNLLPYPYNFNEADLPEGLENVGDGSILVTGTVSQPQRIPLTPTGLLLPELPEGTNYFTASIEVTDLIDATKTVTNPGVKLEITGASLNSDGQFTPEAGTIIEVFLTIPSADFSTGLVIKPQIEAGAQTAWLPYMRDIGNYVDERFNSTNTKIRALVNGLSLGYNSEHKLCIYFNGEPICEGVYTAVLS